VKRSCPAHRCINVQTASQIVLDYVKTVEWPLLVGSTLFGFRKTFRRLLEERLSEVSGVGVSAKFESAAQEATSLVATASAVPSTQPPAEGKEAHLVAESYGDARPIGDHLRAGTPVVLDLTRMADDDAKRMVDYSAGVIYALGGTIERIAPRRFLLGPGSTHEVVAPPGS